MLKQINKRFSGIDGLVDGDEALVKKISEEFLREEKFYFISRDKKNQTLKEIIRGNSEIKKYS